MKPANWIAVALLAIVALPLSAQDTGGLGEVLVTANRNNARYALQDRPVVGLRRQADAAVMAVAISSDSRDEATRKKEIHAVLLAALGRAPAAGVELAMTPAGSPVIALTTARADSGHSSAGRRISTPRLMPKSRFPRCHPTNSERRLTRAKSSWIFWSIRKAKCACP